MSNKKLTIINIFLVFGLSFITHFIYDLFPNIITSCFFPTNESVFEHLKMTFTTYMIVLLIDYYILKIKNKNLIISMYLSAITTIISLAIVFPISFNMFGENMFLTFLIYFITIVIGSSVGCKVLNKDNLFLNDIGILSIIITMIIFAIFTFYPLNIKTYFYDDSK